jgi:hypothetical protein
MTTPLEERMARLDCYYRDDSAEDVMDATNGAKEGVLMGKLYYLGGHSLKKTKPWWFSEVVSKPGGIYRGRLAANYHYEYRKKGRLWFRKLVRNDRCKCPERRKSQEEDKKV